MTVSSNIAPIFEVITQAELKELRAANKGARPHPLSSLMGDLANPSQSATNTGIATRFVCDHDRPWIDALKPRLVDKTDPANSASALAEIRAYGALLQAGFAVRPGTSTGKGQPKPEFVGDVDGQTVIIEVHAKQIDGAEQALLDAHKAETDRALEAFREDLRRKGKSHGVLMAEPIATAPFGSPNPAKSGDTVIANAVSRLCSIKAREHQLSSTQASVLWLDLQDEYSWNLTLDADSAHPIVTWQGVMVSGALWYAHYGWKGAPIMEWDHRKFPPQGLTPMQHDGRFNQPTKTSAVIAAFEKDTVILEHPKPNVSLPSAFRFSAMRLPWASPERSVLDWEQNLAADTVALQKRMVLATAEAAK